MMVKNSKVQITIQVPARVYDAAREISRTTERDDGLKQTVTATIREWILRGMEADRAQSS